MLNYLIKNLSISIFFLSSSVSFAAGVLDFLDPCVAAKEGFLDARQQKMSAYDEKLAENPDVKAPLKYQKAWLREKRQLLREYYNKSQAPIIKASGGDVDKGFTLFWIKTVSEAGGSNGIMKLIQQEFTRQRALEIMKIKGAANADLDKKQKELYDGCPQDVANQVFRGTVTIVTAPVGIIVSNFEAAKNEANIITGAIRAGTGISLKAIEQEGPLGGKNSEARKACDKIAKGLFGGSC